MRGLLDLNPPRPSLTENHQIEAILFSLFSLYPGHGCTFQISQFSDLFFVNLVPLLDEGHDTTVHQVALSISSNQFFGAPVYSSST